MPKNRNKAKDENARKRNIQQQDDFDSPSSSVPSSPPQPAQPGLPTPSSSLGSSTSIQPQTEERLIDFSPSEGPSPASIDLFEQDTVPTFPTPSRQHTLSSASTRSTVSASDILGKSNTTLKPSRRGPAGSSILGGGAPSPPMISTTEGFGSFSVSTGASSAFPTEGNQHQTPVFPPSSPTSPIPAPPPKKGRRSSSVGLGLSFSPPSVAPSRIQSRTHSQGLAPEWPRDVIFSHFESLPDGRKWLVILTPVGVWVWDLANLGTFQEILHLQTNALTDESEAFVLRDARVVGNDTIGLLLTPREGDGGKLLCYSLLSHDVIQTFALRGAPINFRWSEKGFLVAATVLPPSIQIYHLNITPQHSELKHLHTIQSKSLAPFNYLRHIVQSLGLSHPSASASTSTSRSQSRERNPLGAGIQVQVELWEHSNHAEPVFAVNGRFLVYAGVSPNSSSSSIPTHQRRKSGTADIPKDQGGRGGRIGSLLGNAVKSLATSLSPTSPTGKDTQEVSRSAPSSTFAASWNRSDEEKGGWLVALDLNQLHAFHEPTKVLGRWHVPPSSSLSGAEIPRIPTSSPFGSSREERDIVTLDAILSALPGTSQEKEGNVSTIAFTSDGLSVLVGLRDGREVRSYSLVSLISSVSQPSSPLDEDKDVKTLKENYVIHRGFTPSALSGLSVSEDGRWTLIGSWKRGTGHLVAVNPYGGKMDVRSHVSGRVLDPSTPVPPTISTPVQPLLRIRPNHTGLTINITPAGEDQPNTFIIRIPACTIYAILPSPTSPDYSHIVPTTLIPTVDGLTVDFPDSGGSSRSSSFSSKRISTSPTALKRRSLTAGSKVVRPRNFQDIVLFDPSLGVVELRRISMDVTISQQSGHAGSVGAYGDRLREYVPQLPHNLKLNSLQAGVGNLGHSVMGFISGTGGNTGLSSLSGAVSVSPSSAHLGALGGSPGSWTTVGSVDSSASPSSAGGTGFAGMLSTDGDVKMSAKEGLVARWSLGKLSDAHITKHPVGNLGIGENAEKRRTAKDFLAESELSTYPRPLSKQLLRPPPSKSVYLTHQFTFSTLGEDYHALIRSYHFSSLLASSSSVPITVRRDVQVLSASGTSPGEAIRDSIGVDHLESGREEEIPMYPNGFGTRDVGIPINIRRIARDGGEGLGRFGREVIGRSRRVSSGARRYVHSRIPSTIDVEDEGSTPLEFDEADEQFDDHTQDDLRIDDQGEIWETGWGEAESGAVKEMETFEDFLEGVNVERGGTIRAAGEGAVAGNVKKKKTKKERT